jgi:hypothetical protein
MYTLYNTPADYTSGARGSSSTKRGSVTHSIWME